MKGTRSGLAALAVVGLLAGAAVAEGDGDEDLLEVSAGQAYDKGDAATKKVARRSAAEGALERMADVSFLVPADKREDVLKKLEGLIKDEKFRDRGGRFRYSGVLSRAAAHKAICDAVELEKTFGREPVALVVEADAEAGWSAAERDVARAAATELLQAYGFKLVATPEKAALVLMIRGGTEVTKLPPPNDIYVIVGPIGTTTRLFHKATDQVLAELAVRPKSDRMPVGEAQPPGPGVVDKRRVAPAAEKQAREALARDCAKAAVMGVVKRLVESAPAAEAGGKKR